MEVREGRRRPRESHIRSGGVYVWVVWMGMGVCVCVAGTRATQVHRLQQGPLYMRSSDIPSGPVITVINMHRHMREKCKQECHVDTHRTDTHRTDTFPSATPLLSISSTFL